MKTSNPARRPGRRIASSRAMPVALALVATLLSAPIGAVTVPTLPLQTGAAYPPPNIMFILDDSGSMDWDFMPGAFGSNEVPSTSPVNIALNAYPRNTLYYNPNTTYQPWIKADGTRYTGGTSYNSAYSHTALLQSAIDLSSTTRVFYVPKTPTADMSQTASYYRYEIASGGGSMTRSEYGTVVYGSSSVPSGFPKTGLNGSSGDTDVYSFVVPANVDEIVATTSGGSYGTNGAANNNSGRGADLYLKYNNSNVTSGYDCRSRTNNNDESCTITGATAGTWYVGVDAGSNYKNVTLTVTFRTSNRCGSGSGSSDWINCTNTTPTGRSLSAELTNYATWYSYHRTRIKTAKAGASEAFSQLGANLRVGFDTIWNRNVLQIPVGTNSGVFSGTNRSDWFNRLHNADANNGTPLLGALQRTGNYFSSTSSTGPWGPESGSNQISCRQNFAILTTDGYWNATDGYTSPVGDADNTSGPTVSDTAGRTYAYTPARPYIDNFSTTPNTRPDTLADVAMHYWKNDLRTNLENNVPDSPSDPAFWQHMVTFGVAIGQQGKLNPKTDLAAITNGSKRWGDPTDAEDADRIDDLWHASVNGRGNFVTATNPVEFAQGLIDSLAIVATRLGSASNVTANSTSFQTDTRVFQASYVSGKWTGELAAYPASAAGVASTPSWRASTLVPTSGRNIFTWGGTAGATFPTSAQVSALDQSSRALSAVTGADNAAYIAGNRTLERRNGGTLRDRDTVLGDIVDSSPMYLKDNETIFVGANDGMLHAINALTGVERFAYVPGGINVGDLATLSDPTYTHRYFVDGPVAVSTKALMTRNYLVGALGRGGKGVFGLDVTDVDTTAFSTSRVLWERTTGTNMGYVLGDPLVVKLNDGSRGVLVPNGINSSSGRAVLFVLDITTGAILKEIDTGTAWAGGNAALAADNGLSAPRGWDNDGNGTVDYVYAGDLKGNLWKFDLSGVSSATWGVALGGAPMFVARNASNVRQPITAGLALAREPITGRRWVFIGTGSFITNADVTSTDIQSMYGIIDSDTVVNGRTSTDDGDLQMRDIRVVGTVNGNPVRAFDAPASLPTGKKGWYIDLDDPTAGERIISNPRVRGEVLITASIIPPSNNTCGAGGSGYVNAVNAFTGASLAEPFFDANRNGNFTDDKLTPSGGGTPVPVGSIDLGVGMPTLPTVIDKLLVVGGSKGSIGSVAVNPQGGSARRVSWREILRD